MGIGRIRKQVARALTVSTRTRTRLLACLLVACRLLLAGCSMAGHFRRRRVAHLHVAAAAAAAVE